MLKINKNTIWIVRNIEINSLFTKIKAVNKTLLLTSLLFILQASKGYSEHIVGSDMSYECLGEGDTSDSRIYKVTFIQYRECSEPDVGPQIILSLWNMGNHTLVTFPRDTLITIENPDYPCLELPSNICVIKAVFSKQIELLVSDSSYFFVKQFCCRTSTITNIINPSSEGTTQYIEISPEAQFVCNNSPSFQALPPTGLCVSENISLVQSALDVDGDQLVYSFCSPLSDFPGTLTSYPPPHLPVQFIPVMYSATAPLGNGVLDIDASTGLLAGEPLITGQFVVGICVKEYRNGQLLSTIRRDIQLNIVNCPSPVATIDADSILGGNVFLNYACDQEVEIINTSNPTNLIEDFVWMFNIGGAIDTFFDWNPTVFFPERDIYSGHLILNQNSPCSDTANLLINVLEDNSPNFTTEYDTCISGPVQFLDESYANGNNVIVGWEWLFGDTTSSVNENPLKYYDSPGLFPVSLEITDNFNCKDSLEKLIEWTPAPETIIISPDVKEGCIPLTVFFDNLSWPIDSNYTAHWEFGDGEGISNQLNPYYTYNNEGTYSVFVSVTSPQGCYVDTTFNNLLDIHPLPTAQFNYTPEVLSSIEPEIHLIDNSQGAIHSQWSFDGINQILEGAPVHTFADTGLHTIRLIVSDINNCRDTMTKQIDLIPINTYFLPNAFTPNDDGLNDVFKGTGIIFNMSYFNMNIWNRWGQNIFETNDPNQGWNGLFQNTGKMSQAGIYLVTVSYKDTRGNVYNKSEYCTLIK